MSIVTDNQPNTYLLFDGPGIYVPDVGDTSVSWRRDTSGDPFVGVQIDSAANASRVADSVYIAESAPDGTLQDMIDYAAEAQELEDSMNELEWIRKGC